MMELVLIQLLAKERVFAKWLYYQGE